MQKIANQGYRDWLSTTERWEPTKVFCKQHEGNTSFLFMKTIKISELVPHKTTYCFGQKYFKLTITMDDGLKYFTNLSLPLIIIVNKWQHVESLPSPRLIKTHHPISMLPPHLLDKAKVITCADWNFWLNWNFPTKMYFQVIYVGRNVKDICVSSFYHERPDTTFSK